MCCRSHGSRGLIKKVLMPYFKWLEQGVLTAKTDWRERERCMCCRSHSPKRPDYESISRTANDWSKRTNITAETNWSPTLIREMNDSFLAKKTWQWDREMKDIDIYFTDFQSSISNTKRTASLSFYIFPSARPIRRLQNLTCKKWSNTRVTFSILWRPPLPYANKPTRRWVETLSTPGS